MYKYILAILMTVIGCTNNPMKPDWAILWDSVCDTCPIPEIYPGTSIDNIDWRDSAAMNLYWRQLDSIIPPVDWYGSDVTWSRPKYKLWEYWYGTGWYRKDDTTLIAYGDTIIRPSVTGWVTSSYKDTILWFTNNLNIPSGWTHFNYYPNVNLYAFHYNTINNEIDTLLNVSNNWDSNYKIDGIRTDGMPYFLDSMIISGSDLNISSEPVDPMWVRAAPFWYPSVFPCYTKWRDKDHDWMVKWGQWPEVCDFTKAPDYESYKFNIGDTVEIGSPKTPAQLQFYENHKRDPIWLFSKYHGSSFRDIPLDSTWGRLGQFGVVIDKWLEPINNIRYYKVKYNIDYSNNFLESKVCVYNELRKARYTKINWQAGGTYE